MKELADETNDLEIKFQLANVYLWDSQPKQAVAVLEKMVQEYPDNETIQMLLGTALYYSGESEKASHIFENILLEQQQKQKK